MSAESNGGIVPVNKWTKLRVSTVTMEEANAFILAFHRHHLDLPSGIGRYALAAVEPDGTVHGIAVVGLPAALNRMSEKRTMEVSRVATDGHPNACSILYAACARAAKALGFTRIITYVLDTEHGTSLKASGWTKDEGTFGGMPWSNRPGRRDGHPVGPKGRWSLALADLPEVLWPSECEPEPDPQLTLDAVA